MRRLLPMRDAAGWLRGSVALLLLLLVAAMPLAAEGCARQCDPSTSAAGGTSAHGCCSGMDARCPQAAVSAPHCGHADAAATADSPRTPEAAPQLAVCAQGAQLPAESGRDGMRVTVAAISAHAGSPPRLLPLRI